MFKDKTSGEALIMTFKRY